MLLLGTTASAFPKDFSQISNVGERDDEQLAMIYVGYGNLYLLASEYSQALENFQKATDILENAKTFPSFPESEIYLLTMFGRLVAYDNLGLRSQCEQTVGKLFLLASSYIEDDDAESERPLSPEEKQAMGLLRKIAGLAPSTDIREFLLSLIDAIEEP